MTGRGLLGKWGANHAADPIVTRYDPASPRKLQMVAVKRKDTGEWAIPGGMVDAGETVSVTVKREFTEEVGDLPTTSLGASTSDVTQPKEIEHPSFIMIGSLGLDTISTEGPGSLVLG